MSENQSLLQQLQQMLHWKKSKKFYAEKLGITENEIEELLNGMKTKEQAEDDLVLIKNSLAQLRPCIYIYNYNKFS